MKDKEIETDDVPYPAPNGKIWKTNGNSEYVLVDDPDSFDEYGNRRKIRKSRTNITPKKKKRKKKGKKTHRK